MSITKETRDEDGKLHSFNDEPAVIFDHRSKAWYQHGKRHRERDAAFINERGCKYYFLNGEVYTFDKWIKLTPIPEEDKIALLLER
jgi:hypothetical protein